MSFSSFGEAHIVYTFNPKELSVQFKLNNETKTLRVGMSLPDVEKKIGAPERYVREEFDPNERGLYQTRGEWLNKFGRAKKAIYDFAGVLIEYYDDIVTAINVDDSIHKAMLDGANLLTMSKAKLFEFMKSKGYVRVETFAAGDAFRGANLIVVYETDDNTGPDWVAIVDLSKQKSRFPEDKEKGLTLTNCPTRTND